MGGSSVLQEADSDEIVSVEKLSDFTTGYSDVLSNKLSGKYIYRVGEHGDAAVLRSGSYPGVLHTLAAAPVVYAYCLYINSALREGFGHNKIDIRLVNGGAIGVLGDKDKYTSEIINYIIEDSTNEKMSLSSSDIYVYNKKFYNSKLFRRLMALYKGDKSVSAATAFSDENTLWYILLKYAEEGRTNSTNQVLKKLIEDHRLATKERASLFVDRDSTKKKGGIDVDGSLVIANKINKKYGYDKISAEDIYANRKTMASKIPYDINDKTLVDLVLSKAYNYIIGNITPAVTPTTTVRKFFSDVFSAMGDKKSVLIDRHVRDIAEHSKHIKEIDKDKDDTEEGVISLGSAVDWYIRIILRTIQGALAKSDVPEDVSNFVGNKLDASLYGNMIDWIALRYTGSDLPYSPTDNIAGLSKSTIDEYEQLVALRSSSIYKGSSITADTIIKEYSLMYGSCTVYFDMIINGKAVRFSATSVNGTYDWKATINFGSTITVSGPELTSIWSSDYRLLPDLTSRNGLIYKSMVDAANAPGPGYDSTPVPVSSDPVFTLGQDKAPIAKDVASFIFSTTYFTNPSQVLDWATFVWPTYKDGGTLYKELSSELIEIYKREYGQLLWKETMNSQLTKIYEACNGYRSAIRAFIKYNVAADNEEAAKKVTINDITSYIRAHAGDDKSSMDLPGLPHKLQRMYANNGYFMGINTKLMNEYYEKYGNGSSLYESLSSVYRVPVYEDATTRADILDHLRTKLMAMIDKYKDGTYGDGSVEDLEAALKYIPEEYKDQVALINKINSTELKDLRQKLTNMYMEALKENG